MSVSGPCLSCDTPGCTMQAHSDSDESFFERAWAVVAQIPVGRVTTYGDIAAHLGRGCRRRW